MFDSVLIDLLMIVAVILSLYAQIKVSSAYNKYASIANDKGISGADVAQDILNRNGYDDVTLQVSRGGVLSDHFDPRNKTVNLSPGVHDGRSIAAVAIAAHELGHVMQHQTGYKAIVLRNTLLPMAQIANYLGFAAIMIGAYSGILGLFYLGIGLIGIILLFQLVTLPIEFNASARAMEVAESYGYINSSEKKGVKAVLDAAALTYVAGFITSLMNILRLLLMTRRRD